MALKPIPMTTIQPARLISRSQHVLPGLLHVAEVLFEVPKNHAAPQSGTLKLFGRIVNRVERPAASARVPADISTQKPYMVYLQGGPGFGCPEPQDTPLTKFFLDRGYQLLYLDYRGTGVSTPINARHVASLGDAAAQAAYLRLFRQDSIVRDLEAVRACLTADFPEGGDQRKWSIIGQSFGGFVALTYLSRHQDSLREAFLTGGLAPVGRTADEVVAKTFRHVIARNRAYYAKFPEDVERVRRIVGYIASSSDEAGGKGKIRLPGGGLLTVGRFLCSGFALGVHGGFASIHALVLRLVAELDQFGFFTRSALVAVEKELWFDAPIYGVLHEQIYCDGPGKPSDWAAQRVGSKLQEFSWLSTAAAGAGEFTMPPAGEPIFMSGEMVYPWYLDCFPELNALKDVAQVLAKIDDWEPLYDEAVLAKNEVPVYAASYVDDMYVDFDLARETAAKVKGIKVFETNSMYHNATRAQPEKVLGELCMLRDDVRD